MSLISFSERNNPPSPETFAKGFHSAVRTDEDTEIRGWLTWERRVLRRADSTREHVREDRARPCHLHTRGLAIGFAVSKIANGGFRRSTVPGAALFSARKRISRSSSSARRASRFLSEENDIPRKFWTVEISDSYNLIIFTVSLQFELNRCSPILTAELVWKNNYGKKQELVFPVGDKLDILSLKLPSESWY